MVQIFAVRANFPALALYPDTELPPPSILPRVARGRKKVGAPNCVTETFLTRGVLYLCVESRFSNFWLRLCSALLSAVALSVSLEAIFLYSCHRGIKCRLELLPAADLAVSLSHRAVSEYFLDGKRTLQPASLDHLLDDSVDRLTLYASVHR